MLVSQVSPQVLNYNGSAQNPPQPVPYGQLISSSQPLAQPSAGLMQAYYTPMPQLPQKPVVKSIMANADPAKRERIFQFGEHYKHFLDSAKTDLSGVEAVVNRAMQEGFQPWPQQQPNRQLIPGEKFFRVNKDRSVQLIVVGREPISNGFKMIGTHIDAPHISLKAKPIQDGAGGMSIFKTIVHGGIKPGQWTQRNLALVGKIVRQDGTVIKVNIGNKPGDPVFVIPELAIHVDGGKSNITKEALNPIAGSTESINLNPNQEGSISDHVEQILYKHYGVTRDDLVNAQLDLVPANQARDVGFDRALVAGYGSDNKSSVYAANEALFSALKVNPIPEQTLIAAHYGNEEIGSWNGYGARSNDTETMVEEILQYTTGHHNSLAVKNAFKNSLLVSADVTTAIDPVRPDAEEATNSTKIGFGPSIQKDGKTYSTPEASARFMNMIRGTQTQTHAFHQDKGGGGTIGTFLSTNYNADVVDFGVPILGMHSPNEIISKGDLYEFSSALMAYYLNRG
jgi:aspartyl aminopeptidase